MTSSPVTLVTGGSRGIGAATVRQLAAAGHDIVLGYRTDHTAARTVLADVHAAGRRGTAVAADTADPTDVVRLFDAAEELGKLTGLVNNAGVGGSRTGPLTDLAFDDLRHVVDVNLVGYLLCAQQAARRMTTGAAIVNVSSGAATLGGPGEYVHYAATKAATDALTIGLAKELAPAASGSTPSPPASSTPTSTPPSATPTRRPPQPPGSRWAAPARPTRSPPPSSGCSAHTPPTPPAPTSASPAVSSPNAVQLGVGGCGQGCVDQDVRSGVPVSRFVTPRQPRTRNPAWWIRLP
ncbi:hypothetical protein GCM10027605_36770 [Micromonospora zhanjiangensis]